MLCCVVFSCSHACSICLLLYKHISYMNTLGEMNGEKDEEKKEGNSSQPLNASRRSSTTTEI